MSLPRASRSGGPNFLGGKHAPFVINGNPHEKNFLVRDVVLPSEISEGRAASRRELRTSLDRMLRYTDKLADDPAVTFDQYYQQGIDMVLSPQAQAAFDIHRENEQVRAAYGRNDFGQRLLMARRLVEVGVSWLTVYFGGWDHHTKLFEAYRGEQVKKLDQGVAALINDLDERGLLENTMVVVLGEFGRTPKVNKDAGRDHWPHAMSVLMAGAGIPRGQVVGATDAKGYHASENVYRPEDFAASLYSKMGIDHSQMLHTNTGRPIQLVNNGRLIKELFV
jgi:arylsulfatase A-like enzyme